MITEKGEVKLTDFGIAKDLDATALTATGRTLGTAAYMAPEQIKGTPEVSHKTDLYALGVVMYQMLTGEVAFTGPTAVVMMHRHLNDDPPRPSSKVAEIPTELDKVVYHLLAKDPANRPWDAAAVGMVLTDLRDKQTRGEPIAMVWPTISADGTGMTTIGRKPKRKRKKRKFDGTALLQTGSLVVLLLALTGVVAYLLWPPSAQYLFKQAEPLMATDDPGEWKIAEQNYVDELDRRFPNHKYKEQTERWHDQIALDRATRRATVLEKKGIGIVTEPKNEGEKLYKSVFDTITDTPGNLKEAAGLQGWQNMADLLKSSKDPVLRGWKLLAQGRIAEINEKRAKRSSELENLETRAKVAIAVQNFDTAIARLEEIGSQFAEYPELKPRVDDAKAALLSLRNAQAAERGRPPEKPPDARPAKPPEEAKPGDMAGFPGSPGMCAGYLIDALRLVG
jgi:serine/threonine-protein kinase